jgi:diacylglycerol kinase
VISLSKFRKSMGHAVRGLREELRTGHSFRVQMIVFVILIVIVILLKMRSADAALLILVALGVIVLELINSVFERLLDIISPGIGPHARDIKDIMAGAVLVAAIVSLVVGAIIIIPYFRT